MKNGQIIFIKEVEELQQMNPNKSVDIIIDDLCIKVNTDLSVSNLLYTKHITKI